MILVLDDDARIRRFMRRALASLSYKSVGTGRIEVLARLCFRKRPKAVISDARVGAQDGIRACMEIKRLWPSLPVIIMSGDPEQVRRARQTGFEEVLQKPFDLAELDCALRRIRGRESHI